MTKYDPAELAQQHTQQRAQQSGAQADIVIVGAGIVGATLACLLQEVKALKIVLVDAAVHVAQFNPEQFDPRVVALSQSSIDILADAGVWPKIKNTRVCPYKKMHVWDGDGTGNIDFDAAENHLAQLGFICENSVVVSSLSERLVNSAVEVIRGETLLAIHEIDEPKEQKTEARAKRLRFESGLEIEAQLVIGADGAQSKLRELAGISTKEWSYHHNAIVATIETEISHQFCAWQRFSDIGPLAFLPLSKTGVDSNMVSIVWSLDTEQAEKMMALDDNQFCLQLTQHSEAKLGRVLNTDRRHSIPLKQRFASTYIQPGLCLVGDAAHTIHPLAGQGVNLGLYDVKVLAAELIRACKRHIPVTEMATLRRYERKRQPHNLLTMATMEAFKRGFQSDNIALRWARNAGLNTVNQHYFLKQAFSQIASGNIVDV